MLNSPFVLEAYVKSEGGDWLDKKWRCFFIVTRDSIISIRAYPYNNTALIEKCGRWIAELAGKNWGEEFPCEEAYLWHEIERSAYGKDWQIAKRRKLSVCFGPSETSLSYPDEFRVGEKHFGAFSKKLIKSRCGYLMYNYFGEHVCPICGEPLEHTFQLLCQSCAPYPVCDQCGRPITADRDMVYPDTDDETILCVDCYEDAIDVCSITGDVITDWVEVYLYEANSYITIGKDTFNDKSMLSKYFKAAPQLLDDSIAHPEYWIEPESLTEAGRKLYNILDQGQWERIMRNRNRN
jgi:hypothetical protein